MRLDHRGASLTGVPSLAFSACQRHFTVQCVDADVRQLVRRYYGAMRDGSRRPDVRPDIRYVIERRTRPTRFQLTRDSFDAGAAADLGELLLLLEEDLAIRLQELRPDLYFIHSAVVKMCGRAVMLVAPSGGGKSTTAWALVHAGFSYVSDELAPIDAKALQVHPYPRALTLKSEPPPACPLPGATVRTSRGWLVPTDRMPGGVVTDQLPLAAILFLRYDPTAPRPTIRRLARAESVARLYANALNSLAHPPDGLDAAIAIAEGAPTFQLVTSDLPRTCELVAGTLEDVTSEIAGSPRDSQTTG